MLFDGVTLTCHEPPASTPTRAAASPSARATRTPAITFLNCTLTGNQGAGGGGRHGVVAVKVWSQPQRPGHRPLLRRLQHRHPRQRRLQRHEPRDRQPRDRSGENGTAPCERFAIIDCAIEPCRRSGASASAARVTSSPSSLAAPSRALVTIRKRRGTPSSRPTRPTTSTGATREIWNWDGSVLQPQRATTRTVCRPEHRPAPPLRAPQHRLRPHLPVPRGGRRLGIFGFGARSHVRIKDCTINTGTATFCCDASATANPYWAHRTGGTAATTTSLAPPSPAT